MTPTPVPTSPISSTKEDLYFYTACGLGAALQTALLCLITILACHLKRRCCERVPEWESAEEVSADEVIEITELPSEVRSEQPED
jgi:hypothetical protein